MLMPFFKLIFLGEKLTEERSNNELMQWVNERMAHVVNSTGGNMMQLLFFICGFMLLSIVLKNFFLYLAYYILNPLKNKVVASLRADMYNKVLQLPIGYFTEQRKGDLMSRITNDIAEVEQSVVGTLEGWIRDPMQIIINLMVLVFISPKLTLFLLVMLPVMGLIIGRISRSLKKQSHAAAELHGESVSVLDETLTGLRVIKAFTAEAFLRSRFLNINNRLLHTKNTMGYRRDLASPLSETMGIVVFCAVLLVGGSLVRHSLLTWVCFTTSLTLQKHSAPRFTTCKKAVQPLCVSKKYCKPPISLKTGQKPYLWLLLATASDFIMWVLAITTPIFCIKSI
jgi:subfamily B ATP-binding cassette protein MsbA